MAKRRVYFAFDYKRDLHRVQQIYKLPDLVSRSAGGFESHAVWQGAKRRGDAEARGLIDDALMKTSVTVVCVGYMAAYRDYLGYEVERSIDQGNGLVGIRINHLPNEDDFVDLQGTPPSEIEALGYNLHLYTGPERLAAHIEEAHELAQLGEGERLARKRERESAGAAMDAERRREPRQGGAGGKVWIDGTEYVVKNWNSRGFLAASYSGDRRERDRVDISFSVPLAEAPLEFRCQANVLGVNPDKHEIVGVFVDVDEASKQAIANHLGSLRTVR